MPETLRELVVSLSLDANNFTRNMRSIAAQVKEAESRFALAGAGVKNFEHTLTGQRSKLALLQTQYQGQKAAIQQYQGLLQRENQTLSQNMERRAAYTQRLEAAREAYSRLTADLVVAQERERLSTAAWAQDSGFSGSMAEATRAHREAVTAWEADLARYREAYRQLSAELGSDHPAMQQLAQDIAHLENQIRSVSDLDRVQAELTATGQECDRLEGQIKSLEKAAQNATDASYRAEAGLNAAQAQACELEQQIATLSSAWTQYGTVLTDWGDRVSKTGEKVQSVGGKLTRYLTMPLVSLGTIAVKASVSYESAFANVRRTVVASEEEYQHLSDGIEQMSTELAMSAEAIAEVVEAAAHLGIANDDLLEFSRIMINLGNTSNLDADTAATQIARFANIMGYAQKSAEEQEGYWERLGSALVELGMQNATTESEIMAMSLRLAAAGKQVGLTESQVLGVATALSSMGIEAQMGGSAFSKALIKMEVAAKGTSDDAQQALQDFAAVAGMSAERFRQLWEEDALSAFYAFVSGLAQLDEEGASAITTLEEIGISELRLRDTMLRVTNATSLFAQTQKQAAAAFEDSSTLAEKAAQRYGTTSAMFTNLKNRATQLGRTFGNDLLPTLKSLVSRADELITGFLGMEEGTRASIEKFVLFAASLGPAVTIAGTLIRNTGEVARAMGKASTALGAFSGRVTLAGGGLKGLLTVLGSMPALYVAATAAVIAGGAALYDYASGAKAAREAMQGMEKTARSWKETAADTFYGRGGLSFFGLDASAFRKHAADAQSAETWLKGLRDAWQAVGQKSEITVSTWTDGLHTLTDSTRQALTALQSSAVRYGLGGLLPDMDTDLHTLDEIEARVENLLSTARNRSLTETELAELQHLLNERGAIEVRYHLVAEDGHAGFDTIAEHIAGEVRRRQLNGEDVLPAYQAGIVAAAEGWREVNQQLTDAYNEQYSLIRLMASEEDSERAIAALDADYLEKRTDAQQAYQRLLQETYAPVAQSEGVQNAISQVDELFALIQQYANGGIDKNSALQQLNDLTQDMDESALVELYTLLTQIRDLNLTGDERSTLFGELFPEGSLDELQKLSEIMGFVSANKDSLSGLYTMLGEAMPEEIGQIAASLDMTQAELDWAAFAQSPRSIAITAEITGWTEAEHARDSLSLDTFTARFAAFALAKGLIRDEVSAQTFTANFTRFVRDKGYDPNDDIDFRSFVALVTDFELSNGAKDWQPGILANAIIQSWEPFEGDSSENPRTIYSNIQLTGYERRAYDQFITNSGLEVGAWVRLQDFANSPEELLNDPSAQNAQVWRDGIPLPLTAYLNGGEKLSAGDLVTLDADGTLHIIVTPEIQGTAEEVSSAVSGMQTGPALFSWARATGGRSPTEYLNQGISAAKEYANWKDILWGAFTNRDAAEIDVSNAYRHAGADVEDLLMKLQKARQEGIRLDADVAAPVARIQEFVDALQAGGIGESIVASIAAALGVDADSVSETLKTIVEEAQSVGEEEANDAASIGAKLSEGIAAISARQAMLNAVTAVRQTIASASQAAALMGGTAGTETGGSTSNGGNSRSSAYSTTTNLHIGTMTMASQVDAQALHSQLAIFNRQQLRALGAMV